MKRILLMPVLLLALAVSACGDPSKLGQFIAAATSTIANPVTAKEVYAIDNAYAAAIVVRKNYKKACWSQPYADLMKDPILKPTCQNRRLAYRAMIAAERLAGDKIQDLEVFVHDNPTLDAATAIAAAWSAVTSFQNAMPRSL